MSMQDEGAINTGDSWTPPDQQAAAVDESQGLDTSAPAINESQGLDTSAPAGSGNYTNPPAGNAVQRGNQAAGGFLQKTFGAQGPQQNTGDPENPEQPDPNAPGQQMASKIKAMIMGAGAMPPPQMDELASQMPGDTPADKKINLIHSMVQKGDTAGAEAVLQSMRVANQTQSAFAFKALQGVNGKPPDMNAAIHAANLAQENMPDGSNVTFAAANGGVVAHVTMPGTKQTQTVQLNPQQFAQFLDPGGEGQFDKLLDGGAPATLQRLASAGGQTADNPAAPAASAAPASAGATVAPAAPVQPASDSNPNNFGPSQESLAKVKKEDADKAAGVTPGMSDEDASTARENAAQENKWQRDALQQFPWASQAKQRGAYVAAQRDQAQKQANAIEVAGEQGKVKRDIAGIQAGARTQSASTMASAKVEASKNYSGAKVKSAELVAQREDARQRALGQRSNLHEQMATYRNKQQTGIKTTPEEDANYQKLVEQLAPQIAGGAAAPQAPTPQAKTPGASTSATPPPPDQRVANQTKVTTAKGTFVWGDDGHWHPAGQ